MATLNSPQPLSSSLQALLDMDVAISACSTIVSRLYPACNATLPPEPPPGSPESIVSPSSSTTPAQRAKLLLLKGKRLEIEIMTLAIEKSLKGNVTPAHAKAIQAREALRERVATAALIVAKQEEELSTLKDRCTKQLEYLKEVQKYKANPSGPFPQPPIIGPTQQKPSSPASPCLKRQSSSSSLSSPSSARRQCSMPSPRLSAPFSTNSSPISSMRSSTPLSDEVLQAAEQELADPTRERTLNNITSAENLLEELLDANSKSSSKNPLSSSGGARTISPPPKIVEIFDQIDSEIKKEAKDHHKSNHHHHKSSSSSSSSSHLKDKEKDTKEKEKEKEKEKDKSKDKDKDKPAPAFTKIFGK